MKESKFSNHLISKVWREYLPDKIVVLSDGKSDAAFPLLRDRKMIDGKPTAYVCENFVCQKPVTTVEQLRRQIS